VENETKMFPILRTYGRNAEGIKPHPVRIPWSVAELAYSGYSAQHGTSQTLERLAERGGFGASEMDEYVPDWRERCNEITMLQSQLQTLTARLEAADKSIACYQQHLGDVITYGTDAESLDKLLGQQVEKNKALERENERLQEAIKYARQFIARHRFEFSAAEYDAIDGKLAALKGGE
jgi:DNA repair ATPase RecN